MRVYDRDRVRPVSLHSNEWLQANRKYDATEYYRRQVRRREYFALQGSFNSSLPFLLQILPQRQKEQERRTNVNVAKRAPTNATKQAIYRKSMDSASIMANSDYGGVYIGPTGTNGHSVKATTVAVYDS
jgi:hypothetical protein